MEITSEFIESTCKKLGIKCTEAKDGEGGMYIKEDGGYRKLTDDDFEDMFGFLNVDEKNIKEVSTWENIRIKYPMYRDEMTTKQEREFVAHCFRLYENEGFSKLFWSQGGDFPEYIGKPFIVLKRVAEKESDLVCLPMWNIKFEDGEEINAYPDEIIPSEMKANGCRNDFFEEV